MNRNKSLRYALLLALGVFLATSGYAQQPQPAPPAAKPAKSPKKAPVPMVEPVLEPKAMEILKAASDRLAAARAMRFAVVISCTNTAPMSGDMVIPDLHWVVGGGFVVIFLLVGWARCPARQRKEPVKRGLSRVGYARLRAQRVVHTGLRK